MNSLLQAAYRKNQGRPPVWMMRQAGRYHSHYQALRKVHSFMDLCKRPELAVEVTLGPMNAFDFDAAILFSDLLFPLEALGMDLIYDPGPKFKKYLETVDDFKGLRAPSVLDYENHPLKYQFQALQDLKRKLPGNKGLIGFVGSPFTLYLYSRYGSHERDPEEVAHDLRSNHFQIFWEKLKPLLISNMEGQLHAGADVIAVFDTSAGILSAPIFKEKVVPLLWEIFTQLKKTFPNKAILYYSRETSFDHWDALTSCPFEILGVDWREDLVEVLKRYHAQWSIQGNVDPLWLTEDPGVFLPKIESYFERVKNLAGPYLKGWICGLGHGVTPQALEANVRNFVEVQRRIFSK